MIIYVITSGDYSDYYIHGVCSSEEKCIDFVMNDIQEDIKQEKRSIKMYEEQLGLSLEKRDLEYDWHYKGWSSKSFDREKPRWEGMQHAPDYYIQECIQLCLDRILKMERAIQERNWHYKEDYRFEEYILDRKADE